MVDIFMGQTIETRKQGDTMNKGKLIRVTLKDGRGVKMYEVDAAEAGYITLPKKSAPAKQNKMVMPVQNKKVEPVETKELADDLTTIDGIGKATERLLNSHGVRTFEQLRAANVDFLSPFAKAAIERWKDV